MISGTGSLTQAGSSTLTLNNYNTFTGGTTVSGGTLALFAGNSATGVIRGALAINGSGTVNANTDWSLGFGAGTCVSSIAINGGVLNFTGGFQSAGISAGTITMTGGTVSGSMPDWYFGTSYTPTLVTNASTATAVISSGMDLRTGLTSLTFNVASGSTASGVDLLVSGPLATDSAGVYIKAGPGVLALTDSNTYTTTTTISGGVLALAPTALTSDPLGGGGNITFGGGTLQFSLSDTRNYSARIVNSTAGPIAIDTNGQFVTFGSTLAASNTAGLLKLGLGTLSLTAGNYYTGGTTVSGGTLQLAADGTNGIIVGALTINSGATVNANTQWALGYTTASGVSSIAINGGLLNFTGTAGQGGTSANSITMTGGTISGNAFNWYNVTTPAFPTFTTNASTASAVVSSGMNLRLGSGGVLTFNVAQGTTANGVDLLVSGVIANSNSGGVLKTGPGLMSLTNYNTYVGGTTVSGGTLALGSAGGTGIIRGNLTINSGATVTADGTAGSGWSLGYTNGSCVSNITINGGLLDFLLAGNGGISAGTMTMTGGTVGGYQPDWYYGVTSTPTLTTNASTATAVFTSGFNLRLNSGSGGTLTCNVAQGTTAGCKAIVRSEFAVFSRRT